MKTLIIILISSVFTLCHAQSIAGRYRSESGKELIFSGDNFEYTENFASEYGRFTFKGNFKINGGKLILVPKNDMANDTSKYSIMGLSATSNNEISTILIDVNDKWAFPINQSMYILKDINDNVLVTTDVACTSFKLTFYKKSNITKIVIATQAHKRLDIPIDSFYGKNVTIKAFLSSIGAAVGSELKSMEFQILAITESSIKMIKNGEETTFLKIK